MLGHRQLEIEDYLAILRRRLWVIIVPAVVGCLSGYLLTLVVPKRYTSQTLVLVEQPTVPINYVEPVVTGGPNQRLASMQEQILSRTRLQPIVERFELYKEEVNRVPMEELVERLRRSVKVTPITPMPETRSNDLPGFYIAVTANSARSAAQVCAEVTSMFIEENLRLRQRQAEDTTQFLGKQLEEAKARLDEKDAKLAEFQRRYIGELPSEQQTNLNLLMGMTPQLEAVTGALNRAQQDKTFTESLRAQQLAAWKGSPEGQNPQALEQQLSNQQNQLATLKGRYTDDHPDVIKAKDSIKQLKKEISEAAAKGRNQLEEKNANLPLAEPLHIQQLRSQIHQYDQIIQEKTRDQEQIQQQIKALQARVELSPLVEQKFKSLTRDYQTALNFYNDLLKKRNESEMATDLERRQQGEQFRVLDPPSLPEKPSFPDLRRFLLGGLGGGLGLGLSLALLLEYRDKSLRTERDVESCLGVPPLALIPSIEVRLGKNNGITGGRAPERTELKLHAPS